jgi:hypothetical protein
MDIDGPRECREIDALGGLMPDRRGVGAESPDLILEGTGVIGSTSFLFAGASETGGDGGVATSVDVSDLLGGGVTTNGDDVVVAVPVSPVSAVPPDPSDNGDGARMIFVVIGVGFLLALSRSIVASECRNLS